MKLIQAPIEVASASPTCASEPISATLKTILTAVPVSAALTGVDGIAAGEERRDDAADQHERE